MPLPDRCSECVHAVPIQKRLLCHRFPPTLIQVFSAPGPVISTLRPEVLESDVACGEFKNKKEKKA